MTHHNLELIDFDDLFITYSRLILNSWTNYNLRNTDLQFSLRNSEVRRFLYHHIVEEITNTMAKFALVKPVIIIQPEIVSDKHEICKYCDSILLKMHIKAALKIVEKTYPNQIVFVKEPIDLKNEDLKNYLFNICNSFTNVSYRKIKTFLKKQGLNKLSIEIEKCPL